MRRERFAIISEMLYQALGGASKTSICNSCTLSSKICDKYRNGNWYIQRYNMANGTFRYVKGTSGYATAWTNRASQSYDYFDEVF